MLIYNEYATIEAIWIHMVKIDISKYNEQIEAISSKKNRLSPSLSKHIANIKFRVGSIFSNKEKIEYWENLKHLLDLEMSGKYAFHWSDVYLDKLDPKPAERLENGKMVPDWESAIFASEFAKIAVFRSLIRKERVSWNATSSFGVEGYNVKLSLTPNLLESAKWQLWYVYVFERWDFQEFYNMECKSYKSLKPKEIIKVSFWDLPLKDIKVCSLEEMKNPNRWSIMNLWWNAIFQKWAISSADKEFYETTLNRYRNNLKEFERIDNLNVQELLAKRKKEEISREEFTKIRTVYTERLDSLRAMVNDLEERVRIIVIEENNKKVEQDEKIRQLSYFDTTPDPLALFWVDIQAWWWNAKWVFKIMWRPDLVAIRKDFKSYKYLWDMPYRYSKLPQTANFPRILKTFVQGEYSYIIMEKARWRQLDEIDINEMDLIPQHHYDKLISDMLRLQEAWMIIDPSKSSNFFYDKDIWFVFIDLSYGKSDNANYFKDWLLSSVLVKKNLPFEERMKIRASEALKVKIEKALSNNWLDPQFSKK